ncbi:beta-ketoacyl synthase N-terminal-like domain-containing protein [Clostridium saccharoperbutylacetonicum]|uniref:beta-ketoacyl synthase N-terminal-like domain-containing protein n=1 Tax=Clostridium saccharoperbutylacetonicum TaxID=36745 RepID=UPI0039EA0075
MCADAENNLDVAIIGMSARLPKASNVEEFWQNILQGKDCITRDKSKDKLNYVGAYGKLDNIECFDADFFDFNKREAMNLDPQQRFMFEGIYEALEDAGYNSDKYDGKVGLYSTYDEQLYIWNYLMRQKGDWYLNYHLAEINLGGTFSTRIAYKFNFQGPCIMSKYACASSLAAIHQAYQGLLNYECDMAVAGGVCIEPQQDGCVSLDTTISRSGYTKAFDEEADGLVKASGMGVIILKRLEDAVKDHDNIIAILKGTNVNNDGNRKVGFSAPSVQGQEEVISDALAIADIEPSEVGYFETHGTGTVLGDSVELRALKNVFQENNEDEKVYIGSVKSNIGHTSTASGVINVIKASLMLKEKMMPPSINFKKPNSELLEEGCPVVVNDRLRKWESNKTRIAGTSSFGMGGANAIAILSEYEQEPHENILKKELFVVSGKTEDALKNNCLKLAEYLEKKDVNLEDMAYTLQVGRGNLEKKYYAVSDNKNDLIKKLKMIDKKGPTSNGEKAKKKIAFAFSGSGSHKYSIGKELYESNNIFKREMDKCFDIIKNISGQDLKEYYKNYDFEKDDLSDEHVTGMLITFIVGYSLAKLWNEIGVKPDIIIGHSLGEYIGACIAGIFTLETAIKIIIKRTELFGTLPEGRMLAVAAPKEKIEELLTEGVTIGAENGSKRFLVTGLISDIENFENVLKENKLSYSKLPVVRAGHCSVVNKISDDFRQVLKEVKFEKSTISIVSTLTGNILKNNEISTIDYWIDQMCSPVKFYDAIKETALQNDIIFIEIGSSNQLTELIRKIILSNKSISAISSLKELKAEDSREGFLNAVGKLYSKNIEIDWDKLYNKKPYRISLPTYQFDRKVFWRYKPYFVGEKNEVLSSDTEEVSIINEEKESVEKSLKCDNITEKVLKDIFKDIFGVDEISIYDDIYEFGFDSLSVALVTSKIETALGKKISMKEIYSITTISELIEIIDNKEVECNTFENEEVKEEKDTIKNINDIFDEIE